MNNLVQFNNHNIELIQHNGQDYMTLSQIASALEYNNSSSINDILHRNRSEFDEEMTCLIKKGRTRVRIFNREGAWLIGMLSQTPKAPAFRKWVLKVLGAVADNQLPTVPSLTQDREALKAIGGMVKKCCAAAVRQELAGMLDKFLVSGESYKNFYPTSDDDLIKCLWGWYATHHKKTTESFRELSRENDELKCKLLTIKKAVA